MTGLIQRTFRLDHRCIDLSIRIPDYASWLTMRAYFARADGDSADSARCFSSALDGLKVRGMLFQ